MGWSSVGAGVRRDGKCRRRSKLAEPSVTSFLRVSSVRKRSILHRSDEAVTARFGRRKNAM